jgi:hypothetical protein
MRLKKIATSIAVTFAFAVGISLCPTSGSDILGSNTAFAADRYICDDEGDDDHPHIYLVEESVNEHRSTYSDEIKATFKFVDRNTQRLLYTEHINFIFEEGSPAQYQINGHRPSYLYLGPNEFKPMLNACKEVLRNR